MVTMMILTRDEDDNDDDVFSSPGGFESSYFLCCGNDSHLHRSASGCCFADEIRKILGTTNMLE